MSKGNGDRERGNGAAAESAEPAGAPEATNVTLPLLDSARPSLANGLVVAAIVIAALYFGRELLMPLALAILVGFVLDPIVSRLKRWGVPRALAVAIVVSTTLAMVVGTGLFVTSQLRTLGQDLPVYQANISEKFKELRAGLKQPGMFDQLSRIFGTVESELEATQLEVESADAKRKAPTRVQVVPAPPSPLQRVAGWLDTFSSPAATIGIVLVFVVLILLDRGDLRDRMLRLLGDNLHRTTDALDEATERVSGYLTMQLVANVAYGAPLAIGLLLIGVPGALVWGLVAAVLRFVPYIGPMISAVFPLALAFAVDPGWSMLLWTLGLIVTLEIVNNYVIEPWLFGGSTGLSTLSLIMAATFWTTLWGPAGLVLSTPLTVVLLVMGRYLPQLQFFDVLLGSQPPLDAPTRLYQRLLADDVEDAVELALEHAEQSSPVAFYGELGVPALRLATSAHATVATAEHRHRLVLGMERVIEEIREQYPVDLTLEPEIICIGGRWEVDTLAADMAAHALALAGPASRVAETGVVSARYVSRLDLLGARVVCLSYFSPNPVIHAKHFVRRLKARWPDLRIVLAVWNTPELMNDSELIERTGADEVATSMEELVARAAALLATDAAAPYVPAPIPQDALQRVATLRRHGVLDDEMRSTFDGIAKRVADVFDCPVGLVSLLDENADDALNALSLRGDVVAAESTVVVSDVCRDPRFASNPALREKEIRFYAGAPLRADDGSILGTLCVLDKKPRTLSTRDILLLESMAAEVTAAIEAQAAAKAIKTEAAA